MLNAIISTCARGLPFAARISDAAPVSEAMSEISPLPPEMMKAAVIRIVEPD